MTSLIAGKILFPAAVISSLLGTVYGIKAHPNSASDLPLTCEIEVVDNAFGKTYLGVVHAHESVHGRYEITFAKRGANTASINQNGNFSLGAGESATLGQAGFGGGGRVSAEMMLRFDGTTVICGPNTQIDL